MYVFFKDTQTTLQKVNIAFTVSSYFHTPSCAPQTKQDMITTTALGCKPKEPTSLYIYPPLQKVSENQQSFRGQESDLYTVCKQGL